MGGEVRRGEFRALGGDAPLAVGQWSEPLPVAEWLAPTPAPNTYLTITAGESGADRRRPAAKNVEFEVEQLHEGKVVRAIHAVESEGGTLTLVIPGAGSLLTQLSTAREVAQARSSWLQSQPSPAVPSRPRLLSIVSDLGGYGSGSGYGVRVTSPEVMRTELDSLLRLGITGLRTAPAFLIPEGLAGTGRFRARIIGPLGYPTPDKRREPLLAGCPFDPGIAARAKAIAEGLVQRARVENSDEIWALTADEIGAVTDLSVEGKEHLATCERCHAAFIAWLKQQKLSPAQVGARDWKSVRPLAIWHDDTKPWLTSPGLRRRAYLTRQFLNLASASMFTTIRDTLATYNAQQTDETTGARAVYSYALRGCTFVSNGSSLDFFEFYRHADNAIVWETSDRDARSWGWDSYLMDVQRVLGNKLGIQQGIYVKPHRGAPIQRALSAVARGDKLIYWYTFGPDYWKGDAFSSDPDALRLTQRAAQLLGAAEPWLYGAKPVEAPRVAIVKPETTSAWTTLSGDGLTLPSLENAKWTYTALQHAHVPVDPLDERFVSELDLRNYAAIYVGGSNVTEQAALALARYVKNGGTLVASGASLLRNEADLPLRALDGVFGVSARQPPEIPCLIDVYRATHFQDLTGCAPIDSVQASVDAPAVPLIVGREHLEPTAKTEILARYQDGSPAMLRHAFGKGQAYLLGSFAGLEYAAKVLRPGFDMARDFDAERRAYVTRPILGLLEDPVACSEPLVEAVLLKSPKEGFALTLINWAYAALDADPLTAGYVPWVRSETFHDVRLVVHHLPPIHRVYSVALERELTFKQTADGVSIVLERLEEGDVLRLE